MISSPSDRHRNLLVSMAVAAVLVTGCSPSTPQADSSTPSRSAATSTAGASPSSSAPAASAPATNAPTTLVSPASAATAASAEFLPESAPVSFSIPAIGTGSDILRLGLRENGSLDVPPGDPGSPASWYNQSPTPGEQGPSVLLGHVNATDGGPGVFADLRTLKSGDIVEVTREDGTTVSFAVERGEQYPKDDFPTLTVYGNTEGAELRLITCDGYDPDTGEFDDNYVVYAKRV